MRKERNMGKNKRQVMIIFEYNIIPFYYFYPLLYNFIHDNQMTKEPISEPL